MVLTCVFNMWLIMEVVLVIDLTVDSDKEEDSCSYVKVPAEQLCLWNGRSWLSFHILFRGCFNITTFLLRFLLTSTAMVKSITGTTSIVNCVFNTIPWCTIIRVILLARFHLAIYIMLVFFSCFLYVNHVQTKLLFI